MGSYVGQKIGKLEILEMVVDKPYSKKEYLCRCDCGNIIKRKHECLRTALRDGRVASCGCYSKQYLTPGDSDRCKQAGKHRKNAFINGSNVQMTLRPGTITTNTSGRQGVSWSKNVNKWHVYVGYQNYRANLGYFTTLDIAIKIRDAAEDAIKNNTFEDFYFQIRGKRLEETSKYFKK